MPEHEIAIRGGMLIDGTGAPARRADVGIRGGRITAVGNIAAHEAARSIDADGLLVTPGFVDVHTHYDAQLIWDPAATPSINHGVTTIACGNCGYTLAPVEERDVDFVCSLMARVEGIPKHSLQDLDWGWRSWGDFVDRYSAGLGPNVALSVGHSAVRRKVMGEAASSERASPEQVDAMAREVRAAVDAGAFGFTSSQSPIHLDGADLPVPSRSASTEELIAICSALRGSNARVLEFIPKGVLTELSDEDTALMAGMSRTAGVPLNWNTLSIDPGDLERHSRQIDAYTKAAGGDARVVGLMLPVQPLRWLSFETGVSRKSTPGFDLIFRAKTVEERIAVLLDPALRDQIRNAGKSKDRGNVGLGVPWADLSFAQICAPKYKNLQGRRVGDVAAAMGKDPLDLIIDVVVADKLKTGLTYPRVETPEIDSVSAKAWADDGVVLGASDAGAHVDLQCGGAFTTDFLSVAIRDKGLLPLEQAIHLITDVPARLYGMAGRGKIELGAYADINVIDYDALDVPVISEIADMPRGGVRVVASAAGYKHVFVDGAEVVTGDKLTGARPGQFLRSGPH